MKKLKKKVNITIEKTDSGYSAFAEELDVYSTAESINSLTASMIEALNLYYEETNYFVDYDNLQLNLDIPQFFNYYKVLNAKYLAGRIGMNPVLLSQYVQGHKTPSRKQTMKIVEGIHNIGKELVGVRF